MPTHSTDPRLSIEDRLTDDAYARLSRIAPLFDIEIRYIGDSEVELSGPGFSGEWLVLPEDLARLRLVAELCEQTLRWVPYSFKEPADVTLLNHPDTRLERIAFLRRRAIEQGVIGLKAGDPAFATAGISEDGTLELSSEDAADLTN